MHTKLKIEDRINLTTVNSAKIAPKLANSHYFFKPVNILTHNRLCNWIEAPVIFRQNVIRRFAGNCEYWIHTHLCFFV